MQVRPRGQKKPGQHGLQFSALDGIDPSNELSSSVEQAQPGWHPDGHEFWLQFLLILAMRLLPRLLRYNSVSFLLHSILTICPVVCSSQSEMKAGSAVKLNVWLNSCLTLVMQKPYLLCTSSVRSRLTVLILANTSSGEAVAGGSATAPSPPPCWPRPPAESSRSTRRDSTAGSMGWD